MSLKYYKARTKNATKAENLWLRREGAEEGKKIFSRFRTDMKNYFLHTYIVYSRCKPKLQKKNILKGK